MIRVSRVASGNQAVKDQTGLAAGQEYLVAELSITPLLDYDVGVILKEGNHLVGYRHLFVTEYPPLGLADDFFQ